MRNWLVMAPAALLLAACGGGESGGGGGSRNDLAAEACRADTERRLDGKLFEMDIKVLAASMREAPNGEHFLTAPIVIEPGLTSEVKQVVECNVRFTDAKPEPDVVGFLFNW